MALPTKRLKEINPVHSFRHSCAIRMLAHGHSIIDIKNHLGHNNAESTMVYLKLDPARKKHIQQQFIQHTQALLPHDPIIDKLIDWKNKIADNIIRNICEAGPLLTLPLIEIFTY